VCLIFGKISYIFTKNQLRFWYYMCIDFFCVHGLFAGSDFLISWSSYLNDSADDLNDWLDFEDSL
jgi:hypothetical protein